MFQQHIRETAGRFWPCTECHSEPRHIECRGRTRRETMQYLIPALRHSLECVCGRSTGMHAELETAEAEWGRKFTQMPLALPLPSPGRVARIRQKHGKEVGHG